MRRSPALPSCPSTLIQRGRLTALAGLAALLLVASSAGATPLTLTNGWTAAPGSPAPEGYSKNRIVRLSGAVANGTSAVIATLPAELRPNANVYLAASLCNSTPGRIVITPAGNVSVDVAGAFSQAQCRTSLDGLSYFLDGTGFTAMTLVNGWTNGLFGTAPVAARLIDGIVHLRGAVTNGLGATVFTLPPEFKPVTDVYVPVSLCNGAPGRIIIQPSGVVSVSPTSGLVGDAQCFTSFDGLSYSRTGGGWAPLPLANGWLGAPFGTDQARGALIDGLVHLGGAVAGGSSAIVMNLPADLRPTRTVYVAVDLCIGVRGTLQIESSGAVTVQSPGSFTDAQCFTSLESVKYLVDPGFVDLPLVNGWIGGPFNTGLPAAALRTRMVYLRGAVGGGSTGLITTLPPLLRPAADTYVTVDLCGGALGRLLIQPDGDVFVQSATTFAEAQCFTSLEGVTFPSASASVAFTPLTLTSGWIGGGFGTAQPAVALIDGTVHLKGGASGGTSNPIFTLPLGFRPAADVYLPISLCNSAKGRLYIAANTGLAQVFAASSFADAQCFTSLEGVKFSTDSAGYRSLQTENGWVGGAFGTFPLKLTIRQGVAFFQGAVSGGSTDTVTTLFSAYRPRADVYLPVDLCNGAKGRVFIEADTGEVRVFTLSGNFVDAQCFTSLEGIAYPVPEPTAAAGLVAGTILLAGLRRLRRGLRPRADGIA